MEAFHAALRSFRAATPRSRVLLLASGGALIALIATALPSRSGFARLDLPGESRAGVRAALVEMSVPFEERADGLYVADHERGRLLIELIQRQAIDQGAVADVLKEMGPFMQPGQMEQLLQLAHQTELERMVMKLDPVRRASVRIVPASGRRLGGFQGAGASAAVVIERKPGFEFTEEHARTVAAVISAAVKELKPENVKITDTTGRLYRATGAEVGAADAIDLRRQEREYAKTLEDRVGSLFPDSRRAVFVRLGAAPAEETLDGPIRKGGSEGTAPAARLRTPGGAIVEQVSISVILPVAEDDPSLAGDRDQLVRTMVAQIRGATGLESEGAIQIQLLPVARTVAPPPGIGLGLIQPLVGAGTAAVLLVLWLARPRRRPETPRVPEGIERPVEIPAPVIAPFARVAALGAARMAELLADEHAQTVALVVAHLPAAQAGALLERIPTGLQIDVVRRLTTMDAPAPEIVAEVERALDEKAAIQRARSTRRSVGPEAVAEILHRINRDTETRILLAVEAQDPDLAERIRRTSEESR